MSGYGRPVRGHTPVRHGPGDWRCTCGTTLSGGPYGPGRAGARDVMRRFHRLDLNHPEHVITIGPAPCGTGS